MAEESMLQPAKELHRYPTELKERECRAVGREPRIGVALSGGGVRSATFALGLFQGLARQKLLRHVDIISTVSGGGYFGGFFGHLIQRSDKDTPAAAATQDAGSPDASKDKDREIADRVLSDPDAHAVRFLRRNGRYLSPNGAGDLFGAVAIALRNWVSVLIVIGTLALLVFSVLALLRFNAERQLVGTCISFTWPWPWLSPWFVIAGLGVPVLAVPPAWAYWLVGDNPPYGGPVRWVARWFAPVAGSVLAVVEFRSQLLGLTWPECSGWGAATWVALCFYAASVLTVGRYFLGFVAGQFSKAGQTQQNRRRHFSRGLTRGLTVIGVLTIIAVFDTAGLAFVHFKTTGAAAFLGGAGIAGAFRSQLLSLASRFRANERPPLPTNVLIYLAAALVLIVFFGSIASIPHFVAFGSAELPRRIPTMPPPDMLVRLELLTGVVALLALLASRLWPFVNRSSLHAIYEARLRRAYLGASNPERTDEGLEPHPEDGLSWAAYRPAAHGGPLHLINVTINETVDGRTQDQQRDRKGVGMAIGSEGVSVGVAHHALWVEQPKPMMGTTANEDLTDIGMELWHLVQRSPAKKVGGKDERPPFKVFPSLSRPELLDVGQWIAISGGAVSTGLGSRTNVGLSLLTGFFNVRLGYWWRSGVRVARREAASAQTLTQRVLALLRGTLPVQFALVDEWFARFPGTARTDWYLTDGGHFENLGVYELIRREMPLIIVSDAEQDANYEFAGLANVIQKARTDFGAEITFLTDDELQKLSGADASPVGIPGCVRSLESLRRGRRSREAVKDPKTQEDRLVNDGAAQGLSLAHAAIARITYPQKNEAGQPLPAKPGWLIYVKPTLDGDEPVDVQQYHVEHPEFPHESTGDQFFDEAQWESYRRLGEHIAEEVFGRTSLGQWVAERSA